MEWNKERMCATHDGDAKMRVLPELTLDLDLVARPTSSPESLVLLSPFLIRQTRLPFFFPRTEMLVHVRMQGAKLNAVGDINNFCCSLSAQPPLLLRALSPRYRLCASLTLTRSQPRGWLSALRQHYWRLPVVR